MNKIDVIVSIIVKKILATLKFSQYLLKTCFTTFNIVSILSEIKMNQVVSHCEFYFIQNLMQLLEKLLHK